MTMSKHNKSISCFLVFDKLMSTAINYSSVPYLLNTKNNLSTYDVMGSLNPKTRPKFGLQAATYFLLFAFVFIDVICKQPDGHKGCLTLTLLFQGKEG